MMQIVADMDMHFETNNLFAVFTAFARPSVSQNKTLTITKASNSVSKTSQELPIQKNPISLPKRTAATMHM